MSNGVVVPPHPVRIQDESSDDIGRAAPLERLESVFQDVFDDPSIRLTPELSPATYPDWDSVATVRLILSIESEFDIRFTTDQVAEIKSVQSLLTALERQ